MNLIKYVIMSLILFLLGCEENRVSYIDRQGDIIGVVYAFENDDTPLANCTVTLFPTVGSERSGPSGSFRFHSISVGEYSIKVEKDGFRAYEGKVIVIDDDITYLNIALKKEIVYD